MYTQKQTQIYIKHTCEYMQTHIVFKGKKPDALQLTREQMMVSSIIAINSL